MRNIFDPKEYKHVTTGKDYTVLRHRKGHQIRLAHNVLSPAHRTMLSALEKIGQEAATEGQKQEAQDKNQYGKVIMKAGGGKVNPNDEDKAAAVAKYERGDATPSQPASNSRPMATRPSYQSSYGDEAWPSPSETSVGQAQNKADGGKINGNICDSCGQPHPQKLAEGGEAEYIHSKDDYGGGKHYSAEKPEGEQNKGGDFFFDPQEAIKQPIDTTALPKGRLDPNTPPPPIDPEKPIIANTMQPALNWMMTDPNKPQVTPANIATATADAKVDALQDQKDQAQNVADATYDGAVNQQAQQREPQSTGMGYSPEGLAQSGISHEIQGAQQTAGAISGLADKQAAALQQDAAQKQNIQTTFQSNFDNLNKERQSHIADLQKGYIDPEQYWKGDPATGQRAHSRVLSAIGVILGGLGAGWSGHGGNPALAHLNGLIDKNINAQMANLGTKNNIVRYNQEQFGNLKDAADMSRVMQADVIKSQLEKAAAQSQSPLAQAAASKAIGEIDAKYQPIFMNLAIRHTLQGLGSGQSTAPGTVGQALSSLDVISPEQSKVYRERYYSPYDVPGGKSIADRPIDNKTREELTNHEKFGQAASQLHSLITKSRGHLESLNPVERNAAAQQALIIQSLFRENALGTVYKAGEQPLLDKALDGQPLGLAHYFTELPKLEGLMHNNDMMKNATLDSYGLHPPPHKQQSQTQATNPMEGKTATNAQGQRIKMINGTWTPLGR